MTTFTLESCSTGPCPGGDVEIYFDLKREVEEPNGSLVSQGKMHVSAPFLRRERTWRGEWTHHAGNGGVTFESRNRKAVLYDPAANFPELEINGKFYCGHANCGVEAIVPEVPSASVPAPAALPLMLIGLAALGLIGRKRG